MKLLNWKIGEWRKNVIVNDEYENCVRKMVFVKCLLLFLNIVFYS